MGVKGRKLKHYSGDFKVSAVEEVLTDQMGLRETARKYGVTHKMIQTWIRLYLEKGKDYFNCNALKQKKNTLINNISPTQTSKHINLVTPRKPKHPNVDESLLPDEIRNELNKLRMENEYLKKLNALVRKKEKSQTRIKLK